MPRQLRLISLESVRAQDGDAAVSVQPSWGSGPVTTTLVPQTDENLRLRVILDGRLVDTIKVGDFTAGTRYEFRNNGSLVYGPFVDSAEIALREEDDAFVEGIIDDDPDDTIGPFSLPLQVPGDSDSVVHEFRIANDLAHGYDAANANYLLRYQVLRVVPQFDSRFLTAEGLTGDTGAAPVGSTTGNWRLDKGNTRWICAIDGGGMRGIIALRALEQLEAYYETRCSTMFDMFAGTSTGGIIAAALAAGVPVKALIALYRREDIRRTIFEPNVAGQKEALNLFRFPEGFKALGVRVRNVEELMDLFQIGQDALQAARDAVSEKLITPRFRKENWRSILSAIFSRQAGSNREFLTLADCRAPADPENGYSGGPKDIFLTAYDMVRGETTYFTAFHERNGIGTLPPPLGPTEKVFGTYRDVRLVDAVEASSSAPTYFAPVDRFVDGGVGAYNSPAFAAAVEALFYSRPQGPSSGLANSVKPPLYEPFVPGTSGVPAKGTVVWSFGTGSKTEQAESASTDIAGRFSARNRSDTVAYWGEKVINSLLLDSAKQQDFLCRKVLADKVRYYRFDVIINESTLKTPLDLEPSLNGTYAELVGRVKLAAIEPEDFAVVDEIGRSFAAILRAGRFHFDSGGMTVGSEQLGEQASLYAENVRARLLTRL
jgi:predicted acylesterase/phospholipase RssA